ncbi:Putative F-box protein [Dendrobium catenatum]|uniref:F-box protein n=1 Tax=Dendrobium catenatum TaxID=906689 RepID=A0A2I0XJ05_9ASPA|nr:Putative F-box protein [Dendrobium catenatum]
MSSSWSDLPLDLLISIGNKLHNTDLFSFRSICSQWHSAVPVPNPCPNYLVSFNSKNNMINFVMKKNESISRNYIISLPFSSSSPMSFFGSSNGWLVFIACKNETLHLFDPVSNRKFIFPPLYPKILHYYKKVKPSTVRSAYSLYLRRVVVSSSIKTGIAVAGIVHITNRRNSKILDRRIVFYKHGCGDCQRWCLLMEGSKGIRDIILAGDDRFYAIGNDWEFYMLDERPPSIKLKRFKLWLPKHILEADSDHDDPADERVSFTCINMIESGETDIVIYGSYCGHKKLAGLISLKINVAKLRGDSNNVNVACEAKWGDFMKSSFRSKYYFTPSLRAHHSKFLC